MITNSPDKVLAWINSTEDEFVRGDFADGKELAGTSECERHDKGKKHVSEYATNIYFENEVA